MPVGGSTKRSDAWSAENGRTEIGPPTSDLADREGFRIPTFALGFIGTHRLVLVVMLVGAIVIIRIAWGGTLTVGILPAVMRLRPRAVTAFLLPRL